MFPDINHRLPDSGKYLRKVFPQGFYYHPDRLYDRRDELWKGVSDSDYQLDDQLRAALYDLREVVNQRLE